ncbi:MAG: proteasome accessory factor PafA2 family protein, partial [Burkholderiales bacterium]|nr:proteasome accessory factor PafA2 family protein [Burkholderiales bacterium]
MSPVDKILGADVELGNVLERATAAMAPDDDAARLLLAEIDGVPAGGSGWSACGQAESRGGAPGCRGFDGSGGRASDGGHADQCGCRSGGHAGPGGCRSGGHSNHGGCVSGGHAFCGGPGAPAFDGYPRWNPQDRARRFLPGNGGCAYIDLGHLEVCMPEVRSARDFVRYHHAGLALARDARAAAEARLREGERLVVMANNSDRQGASWGGHLNVLITRELWRRIFERLYPELFVLAAYQVSSILYTGQGKVGAENGKPWVPYQITQRGDFFECLEGVQTTCRRPIVNSRDEAHCGPAPCGGELARLHVIFHDTTLTHTSNYLKAGATQLVLALMETGWCDRRLMLENPLEALGAWGRDPELGACARLADGRGISAIEHQRLFLAAVKSFVAAGDAACVPEAERIVWLWEDTLERLERRDTGALARRLDWVLKRELLARAIDRNPGLGWDSPAIRAADLRFASLDAQHGLYEALARGAGVDMLV